MCLVIRLFASAGCAFLNIVEKIRHILHYVDKIDIDRPYNSEEYLGRTEGLALFDGVHQHTIDCLFLRR